MSLHHLTGELETGLEIFFTGRTAGQYLKTGFILCDNYSELTAKLFLSQCVQNWSDQRANGSFKNYHNILSDVEASAPIAGDAALLARVQTLHTEMKVRHEQRNDFFHSASLLKLNIHLPDTVFAYCGLLDYGRLLFGGAWDADVAGRPVLANLTLLVRLEQKAINVDPSVTAKVNAIFRDWRKNKDRVQTKGAFGHGVSRGRASAHGHHQWQRRVAEQAATFALMPHAPPTGAWVSEVLEEYDHRIESVFAANEDDGEE